MPDHTGREVDWVAAPPVATVDGHNLATTTNFDVVDPATGEAFARAPAVSPDVLDDVFTAAEKAYGNWRRDDNARREALRLAASAIEAAADTLAVLLTREQGKPLKDARNEIRYATTWMHYYADLEIPRQVVRDDDRGYEEIFRRPLGVVAAITPWNYPVSLAAWKIAPALRAGNTIVVKPSPYTPLTTLAIGHLLRGVLPDGVLNVISGPEPLGSAMVQHPLTRKVSFTGSTAVGKAVAKAAADDLKRITLELGGNDPAIVLPDADVASTAARLFAAAFRNNGQVCFAAKRIYAHADIHAELVEALAELARSARVGDGLTAGVQLGPINNQPQWRRVDELVQDAIAHGARAVTGGRALDRAGYFFAPTILDRISDGVRIVDEEQFGPALPVVAYRDEQDAIDRANRSTFGLTASVWSADPVRAAQLAAQLDCGQVSINNHGTGVQPHLPYGGHKWSGIGVENGPWGLDGFSDLQVVTGPPRAVTERAEPR